MGRERKPCLAFPYHPVVKSRYLNILAALILP